MSNNFDFDINDFDFSEISDNSDYVRPPDKPIREILNGSNGNNYGNNTFENDFTNNHENSNPSIFDLELEKCLRDSELSFLLLEKKQKDEEEERKRSELIIKERKLVCESIRRKLEKIKGHDIANRVIYEIILSIIEMWELCQLEYFEAEKDSYEAIFNTITSIRMTKDEHKFLIDLIQIKKE
jgi:hypothetical protein